MKNTKKTMPLIGNDDIVLYAFAQQHAAEFVAAVHESVATVGTWMPWCRADFTQDDACQWFESCQNNIQQQRAYDIGIFSRHDAALIGGIAINRIDHEHGVGNIGYWVRQSQQNKGFALMAVELIKQFGFSQLALNRLEIVVLEDNLASRRVAEKAHAQLESIAANRLVHQQQSRPAAIYALLP